MCVISVCPDEARPTEEQVKRMWYHNDHGGGVAWREKGKVQWKKGLNREEMIEFAQLLPHPFILHFRIASIGGQKPELTHPFAISQNGEEALQLAGETDKGVVFHNGHWNEWHGNLLAGCQRANQGHGEEVPRGPWSDSRAMAWLFRYYGMGFLDTLTGQRTVVLTPDRLDFGIGDGWRKKDGIWFSNDVWDYDYSTKKYYVCRQKQCYRNDNLNDDGYCPQHTTAALAAAVLIGGTQRVVEKPSGPGGGHANLPFDPMSEWAQAELAWALFAGGVIPKEEAQAVCSKNKLKRLREQGEKARAKHQAQLVTTPVTIGISHLTT